MIRSIVYVSTATSLMSENDLQELLLEARRLNLETEVTGVLLYDGGVFMQCFEGDEAGMAVTYERILRSRRHRDLIELLSEEVPARRFSDWVMGFRRAGSAEMLALSTARWRAQLAESAPDEHSSGMFLLRNFWRQSSPLD